MNAAAIDMQIQRLEERKAKLEARKTEASAREKLAEQQAKIERSLGQAVKTALAGAGVEVGENGLRFTVNVTSDGVRVLLGSQRGSSGSTSPKKTITTLGISAYVLPNGEEVSSPAKVLDHFGYPHQAKGSGDAAHRQIFRFVRENQKKAASVKVRVGEETLTLADAVTRVV